jgi:uncharacterized coiled-coil DUF342 family protein
MMLDGEGNQVPHKKPYELTEMEKLWGHMDSVWGKLIFLADEIEELQKIREKTEEVASALNKERDNLIKERDQAQRELLDTHRRLRDANDYGDQVENEIAGLRKELKKVQEERDALKIGNDKWIARK